MALVQRLCRCAVLGGALPFIVLTATAVAQTQAWIRGFGTPENDGSFALAPDDSGGVYVSGLTAGSFGAPHAGPRDVWLARYDAGGGRTWIRQTGHLTNHYGPAAASDGAGGVFLSGTEAGAWVERFDGAGNSIWIRQVGSGPPVVHGAASDGAGGVFVCGETWGSFGGANAGMNDAWLMRYDGAGNLLWLHQFGTADEEYAAAIAPDGSGGAIVAVDVTYLDPTNPWTPLGFDTWLVRYDALGNQVWMTTDVTWNGRALGFPEVATDGAGGVYVSGMSWDNDSDAVLGHYDGAGNRTWMLQLGTSEDDFPQALAPDGAGGVYMAGSTSGELGGPYGNAWVTRYDAAGNQLWIQQFSTGSDSEGVSAATPDGTGGAYITGVTYDDSGVPGVFGDFDVYLARHDGDSTVRYCAPSVPNLAGRFGAMGTSGSRITQQNDLGLFAYRLPERTFGYFLTSRERGLVVGSGGSQGDLCLGGTIGRFRGAGQVMNSGAGGAFSLEIDLTSMPQASGSAVVLPGETWIFQAWYRDRGEDPTRTSNFTDALAVTFQ